MVQRPTILLSIPGRIVEVRLSLGDMVVFTENSSGQSRIMQVISCSSSSNSLKGSGILTLAEAGKVVLIWGIDIPEMSHFLFLPLEA